MGDGCLGGIFVIMVVYELLYVRGYDIVVIVMVDDDGLVNYKVMVKILSSEIRVWAFSFLFLEG